MTMTYRTLADMTVTSGH